jgi:hypothetical protein
MAQLSVTETESISLRITAKQAPPRAGCQHRTLVYDLDGATGSIDTHEFDLATEPTADEVRAAVLTIARLRTARGKPIVGVRLA